jgi:hypothetical protein
MTYIHGLTTVEAGTDHAVTEDSATASSVGDTVPVTEADSDGNNVPEIVTEDASLSCRKTNPSSRPKIKMLSCLFPSQIWCVFSYGKRGSKVHALQAKTSLSLKP